MACNLEGIVDEPEEEEECLAAEKPPGANKSCDAFRQPLPDGHVLGLGGCSTAGMQRVRVHQE